MNDYTTTEKYEIVFTQPRPKGEQTDTEIQVQIGSALERKAAISQPGVLISASDPKRIFMLTE
jgi:hypothetical protein